MTSRNGYTKLADDIDSNSMSSSYHEIRQLESTARNKRASRKPANSGRGSTESSTLVGEVQNVKAKKVYVFSDGTIADNEDETLELNEMTRRSNFKSGQRSYRSTSSSQYDDIVTKEIPIQKTDTLQSLSIQFRCPVSELKRINGLYNDAELFALAVLKIPVRSHQNLLQQELDAVAKERITESENVLPSKARCAADIVSSETSEDEHFRSSSRDALMDMVELHSDPSDQESNALLDREWSHQKHKAQTDSKREKRKFDKIIFRSDEKVRVLAEKVQRQADAVGEVTSFIGDSPLIGQPPPRPPNCLSSSGVTLRCLIIVILLLCVVVPTASVVYWYYYVKKS